MYQKLLSLLVYHCTTSFSLVSTNHDNMRTDPYQLQLRKTDAYTLGYYM